MIAVRSTTFSTDNDGLCMKVCLSSSVSVTASPEGAVPVAVAVFVKVPASISSLG